MKKYLVSSLMLGAFLLVLTGMPLQSYAGHEFEHHPNNGHHEPKHQPKIWGHDSRDDCQKVPEPSSLALLSSGMAGIGLYGLIRRKNRK